MSMAAEVVAATPSHATAAAAPAALTATVTNSSSSPLMLNSSSSLPDAHHQQPHRPHFSSTSSPNGEPSSPASFFSHRGHPSPGGSALLPPTDRNVPRGLPPMVSSIPGASPTGSTAEQRQTLSPRSMALALSESQQATDALSGDSTAPRKRSKVSRACDECRRKKIRCDATSESGNEQCSSCKRVGSKCSFSRVPMKRGPSKGYIKELADRLNTLENSISTGDVIHPYGPPGDSDLSPGPSDSTSPPPNVLSSAHKQARKRTLSSSSDFQIQSAVHLQPLSQPNPGGRASERLPSIDSFHPTTQQQHQQRSQLLQHERQLPRPQQSRQPPTSTADIPRLGYTSLSPDGARQYWKGGYSDSPRRSSIGFPYETDPQRPPTTVPPESVASFSWDEESIDQYYDLIHPTFPLLPHDKTKLQYRLGAVPTIAREALLEALYALVRSNPSAPQRPNAPVGNPRRAAELCVIAQFETDDSRSADSVSLICLQTLILMALEADNHGPATQRGQGPARASWVGSAIGMAYHLKLHTHWSGEKQGEKHQQRYTAYGDQDSDEKLKRRAWLLLVVLDRWHAISTSSPLFIPDANVILSHEDQALVGLAPYHLVRLSIILGHISELFTSGDDSTASRPVVISHLLRGELELFRQSVEVVWGSLTLVHVAYYHVKLLTLRHSSVSEPRHLLEPALRISTMLDHSSMPITPLNHHFAALALITLVDLADIEDTRDEAWRGIRQLSEALEKRRGLATREDSVGWDRAIKELIQRREGEGNLVRLAESAIGARSRGLDREKLVRYGYLGSIVQ